MTFQSLEFLLFLPIVFLLYWTFSRGNKNIQNTIIVSASLVFYGWWDVRFLGLLLLTAFSTFLASKWISKTKNIHNRKIIYVSTIILNVGVLFFFKYYNFFIQSLLDTFSALGISLSLSTLKIILPVGISFYTFSALSYSIDVYQKRIEATNDWLAYLAYVTFFPSILSGPISRAQKQLPQYYITRIFDYEKVVTGCKQILLGGVMKMCLADRLGIYVDAVYTNIAHHNGTTLLVTSIFYTLQIYADFAGYSLMAIGIGKLFGIELPTNFIRPYFAKTVTDFWRRWHISLTTWFRDYIYFPLGGNRCNKTRWMFNTMVVFTVSGLWHGAAYTFLIWGALHGACMVIEREIYGDKIKHISNSFTLANIFRWIITLAIVNFAWIFFRVDNLEDVITVITKIFTENGPLFIDTDTMVYAMLFMILVFIKDYLDEFHPNRITLLNNSSVIIRWATYIFLITMILLFGVLDGGSFIYFQF